MHGPGVQRRSNWPAGLLAMLAIVAAVEAVRRDADRARLDWITASWAEAGRAARDRAPGCTLLCLGDSQIQQGLQPRILEARTGEPAYNLAVPGGQPAACEIFLRRALAAGARPRTLILGHFPGLLATGPEINRTGLAEMLDLRETLELAWTMRSPDFLAQQTLRRLLPTINRRDRLRAGILSDLGARPDPVLTKALAYAHNRSLHRGAQAMPPDPDFHDPRPMPGAEPPRRRWKVNRLQARQLDELLALAASRGITVYWVVSVLSPETRADRERNGLEAPHEEFLRELLARHPNLVVLDGRRAGFDASLFHDTVHLDRHGAARLSAAVADAIASRPPGRRWVDLSIPSLAGLPDLEDVEQTRLAIAREQDARTR